MTNQAAAQPQAHGDLDALLADAQRLLVSGIVLDVIRRYGGLVQTRAAHGQVPEGPRAAPGHSF